MRRDEFTLWNAVMGFLLLSVLFLLGSCVEYVELHNIF